MKNIVIYLLGMLIGLWLVFDGFHVFIKGKYFGPPEPGPWSKVVEWVGINPFQLGLPFILLGMLWLVSLGLFYKRHSSATGLLAVVSIATIWYFPFGTVISGVILAILVIFGV